MAPHNAKVRLQTQLFVRNQKNEVVESIVRWVSYACPVGSDGIRFRRG